MEKKISLLKLKNVSKFYYNHGMVSSGFNRVNLEFNLGEFVVITGESGSGKSTLLNVISGLDSYEEGEMYIDGKETSHYGDADFENYRKAYIGSIFQSFNLVSSYTVYQNVELVLLLNGYNKKDIKQKVLGLIKDVDLYRYRNTKVSHLSGGQKQRVAIARALAKDTPIIIADEPTGNLDLKAASSVLKLLSEIAKEKLVIVVTHNYEQVQMYATRKIKMHDGKVIEDIELKSYKQGNPNIYEYQKISLFNKLRLGIRNTFNILPKFILMAIVFLFITIAFLSEYASFKKNEYMETSSGYNYYFIDTSDTRIVVNKNSKEPFTKEEIANLKNIEHVTKVNEADNLVDLGYMLNNDNIYFYGSVLSAKEINAVDEGRMPENENEVVVAGSSDDYYLAIYGSSIFEENLFLYNNNGLLITDDAIKVVGIIYDDSLSNDKFYVSESLLEASRSDVNRVYSSVSFTLNNHDVSIGNYDDYQKLVASDKVSDGTVIISDYYNDYCKNYYCVNSILKVKTENIYSVESLDLTVAKTYNKYNYKNITGLNYEDGINYIFVSNNDYNKLYNSNIYQLGVYVDNYQNVDKVNDTLKSLNYHTLLLKDAKSNSLAQVLAIIKIFKLILLIVLFIVLFFISYFVIKLIQKSKNIYYATVRILGASKKDISSLIKIELYTIFNLVYFAFMIVIFLVQKGLLNIDFVTDLAEYLALKDYIIVYILMFAMSYLIAWKYSRKLFNLSAMKAYNEEA